MKIVSIVGARPQFIKLAPLSIQLRKYFQEVIIHTGQHYNDNMSRVFFDELNIPAPDYNLDIGSGKHGYQTGKMLAGIEEVLLNEKPSVVIVFGDTNTTIAGAMAATKLQIPVTHVEAGLRSFNKTMPEEINRILTDHCSDLLFAPTKTAVENLRNEGLQEKTYLTGDIMLDALHLNVENAQSRSKIIEHLELLNTNFILLTLHRPYNVDQVKNIKHIFNILSKSKLKVVFPIHPRTKKVLDENEVSISDNIKIIEPVGYLDFLILQKSAEIIITDSGGIQKEAYLLKKPCVTVRPETEWIETVNSGWNKLVGFDDNKLASALDSFNPPFEHPPLFGEYSCASSMVSIIRKYLE